MREYRGSLWLVLVCIFLSAIAVAASSLFLQGLIDDYIVPRRQWIPLFSPA